jgi:hypothetical protein
VEEDLMRLVLVALVSSLLAGCGAGGGGAAGGTVQSGSVAVEFSTEAGNAATVLYAVQFTLQLPAGATLPADPASGEVSVGALRAADGAALVGARYLAATAGAPASVKVNIIDPGGFTTGVLATLTCSTAQGTVVNASAFSLAGFSAKDASGAVIPGITPHFTVKAQ